RTVGITNWFGGGTIRIGGGTIPTQAGSVTSKPESADGTTSMSYDAKHKHRLGSCRGRLIVNEKGMAYESIDEISDSRQWQLRDIKELIRSNPYEIKITPFDGNEYHLDLQGNGMDNAAFKSLVDRITAARSARQ